MKIRLTPNNCNVSVDCMPEHTRIRGNAIASGDDAYDKKVERKIQRKLDNGNEWAWCTIRVTVTPKPLAVCDLSATDYLGCCSYESKADFIRNSGYYEDMVNTCIAELQETIDAMLEDELPTLDTPDNCLTVSIA